MSRLADHHRHDGSQALVFFPERFARFDVLRVDRNASHRTDLHALRLVKMAHALGAFVWVDFVDFLAKENRLVRALGLAHVAVDAFVGDQSEPWRAPHPLKPVIWADAPLPAQQRRPAHHLADIAAELADLAHQRAADALQRRVGQQEHRLHLRAQLAVHGRHLGFVVKVGQVADAAHHARSLLRAQKSMISPSNGSTFTPSCFQSLPAPVHARFQRKQRFLVMGNRHGNDELVKQPGGATHHVVVAQREWVRMCRSKRLCVGLAVRWNGT